METGQILHRLGADEQDLGGEFERLKASGVILGFAGVWMTPEAWAGVSKRLLEALKEAHAEAPERILVDPNELLKGAGIPWKGKVIDRMVSRLVSEGVLRENSGQIALVEHKPVLKTKQRQLLDQVVRVMQEAAPNVPSYRDLAASVHVPLQAITQIVQIGIETGEIVALDEGLCFPAEFLGDVREQMVEEFGEEEFGVGEFRDWLGSSRKFAVPILEYFDRTGITVRDEDSRKIVKAGP